MGRINSFRVRNYRSIGDWVTINMPQHGPLVILGENNAGKSNLIRALDIVLGETWPTSFHPEDHDYHDRDRESVPMKVHLDVRDVRHQNRHGDTMEVSQFLWHFDPDDEERACGFDVTDAQGHKQWGSSSTREQIGLVIIGADRRLQYQMSYASKWTMLSKLMRKFHDRLVSDQDRVDRLKDCFSDVVAIFREVEEFSRFDDELQAMAAGFVANLQYGLDLDFSAYDPSNYYRSLRVHPTSAGEIRSFDELGTGQEQILAVAFAYAYARAYSVGDEGLVMVIEEPEAHLHPIAQQWLGHKIRELQGEGVQIIITTHSPAFVDLSNPGSLVCVRKTDSSNATMAIQHSRPGLARALQQLGASRATADSIGPFYEVSATVEHVAGLFARACVVVEGPTEVLAIPELLTAIGIDVFELGVAFVAAGGIGAIARWLRLYSAYGIPTFALFDFDSPDDPTGSRRADLLGALGVSNQEFEAEVDSAIPLSICNAYGVFSQDFETGMRELFPEYVNHEETARSAVGAMSKPFVAREACRSLAKWPDLTGWAAISELGSALQRMVAEADTRERL